MFIRVDLPEPEAPVIATISPASILRLMFFSAVNSRSPAMKLRVMPHNSSSAWVMLRLPPQSKSARR